MLAKGERVINACSALELGKALRKPGEREHGTKQLPAVTRHLWISSALALWRPLPFCFLALSLFFDN